MGKVLIIKDADFSENGIPLKEVAEIADTFTLYRGYNANGEMPSEHGLIRKRLGVQTPVDLSSYISNGYKWAKFTLKNPSTIMQYISFCEDTSRNNRNNITTDYTSESVSVLLDSDRPYLILVIKRADEADFQSSSYDADAILTIELM